MLASLKLARRVLLETDKRLLWKLAWNMGFKGMLSVQRHKRAAASGASSSRRSSTSRSSTAATSAARAAGSMSPPSSRRSSPTAFHKLIREAKAMGNVFFGIVGGEPFMHPHLLDMLAEHPDCYFQIFTNGHFITDERAKRMRQLGNVTPLISVEGTEIVSDERRGRAGVLSQDDAGHCRTASTHKVFTGVCTSLCQTNIDDLLHGEVGRPADRDGRDVHVVPRLPPDGPGRRTPTCA